MAIWKEVAGLCHLRSFLLFHRRENSFSESTQPLGRARGSPFLCSLRREGRKRVLALRPQRPLGWAQGSLREERAGSLAGRRHRRDAGDLGGVIRPWLQVLQGEERRVVHAERVGGQRLCQALLEGLLLQLQEDAVRLLPLGLTLLRSLSPAPGTSRYPRFWFAPRDSLRERRSLWQHPDAAWAPLMRSLILKVL